MESLQPVAFAFLQESRNLVYAKKGQERVCVCRAKLRLEVPGYRVAIVGLWSGISKSMKSLVSCNK